jgi:hypothetical protein
MLHKTKQLTIRVSLTDIEILNKIKTHYNQQGIKLCRSKIVRDILLNFPLD